jgi:hypothetical protein
LSGDGIVVQRSNAWPVAWPVQSYSTCTTRCDQSTSGRSATATTTYLPEVQRLAAAPMPLPACTRTCISTEWHMPCCTQLLTPPMAARTSDLRVMGRPGGIAWSSTHGIASEHAPRAGASDRDTCMQPGQAVLHVIQFNQAQTHACMHVCSQRHVHAPYVAVALSFMQAVPSGPVHLRVDHQVVMASRYSARWLLRATG